MSTNRTDEQIGKYVEQNRQETLTLIKELAAIPAPSHHEEKRAHFCLKWLQAHGAGDAYIDDAGNVIFPYACEEGKPCVLFMAHMDVVFPDTEPLPVKESPERLYAPGIGDDTANLVNLLMCVKYVLENRLRPANTGILFVANTCEEGLGNLKGTKAIFEHYGRQITEMMSFDVWLNSIAVRAVGSCRYKVTVRTKGGHSYADFGEKNAIEVISGIIQDIYRIPVPPKGRTTYNVGTIEGGTSVNTIAGYASMCCDLRSDDRDSLAFIEERFQEIISAHRCEDITIETELLGMRPCGGDIPRDKMDALVGRQSAIIEKYSGKPVKLVSASTDANVPLSLGIPAVTFGTVNGAGMHTYQEWIEKDSLIIGQQIALASVGQYCYESDAAETL